MLPAPVHAPRLSLPRPRAPGEPAGPRPRLRDLGHLRPILRDGLLDAYLRWAVEAGTDYVAWVGPTAHVVAVEPASIREVLTEADRFTRNIDPTANLFGRGILRLEGEAWQRRRALFAPALRGTALAGAVPIVQQEVDRLVAAWRERSGEFRPARDLSFCLLRVLGRFLFDFEFDHERHGGRALHRALVVLASDTVLRHLFPSRLVAAVRGRAIAQARRYLDALCEQILRDAGDAPFMRALRDALASGQIDRPTALDELRTFLIAGHETSATAIAWAVALMGMHPEQTERLREQTAGALDARTPAEVAALGPAVRWARETMRLFPPVPMSVSVAARDTTLGRLRVPRGTRVDVCSYVLHRMPGLWEDPERFDPDRFTRPLPSGAFLPFLQGPHTCLGRPLALIELPLIIARVAHAFQIELPRGPPRVNLRISLHPANFWARLRPR